MCARQALNQLSCTSSSQSVVRSYRQEYFPVGLHNSYNGENRQAEEADAHKHAYPSCPVDVIVVGGFKQRVETVLVRYKKDALCS